MSSKSLERARQYVDKKNIRIINLNPIGRRVVLEYINHKGQIIPYETIITQNERSEKMNKSKAIRIQEEDIMSLNSDSSEDDGWIADDEK